MEKNNNLDKKKVLLGLSGGVDSTAACLLLKEKGYDVYGYWFDITGRNLEARSEVVSLAEKMEIDLICEDVSKDFSEIVINRFCNDYLKGRTPNPCIICNPNIKFLKMAEAAERLGIYYIATGHYCNIVYDTEKSSYHLKTASNSRKDQSYMLYRLPQSLLRRIIFPLGDFEDKEQIRDIARRQSLKNAEKKDSQEICFIDADDNYADFIKRLGFKSKEGLVVTTDGKTVGTHKGIINYTIGQRKGLGIALGQPAFVTKIDCEKNQIVLGSNEDLFSHTVISEENFFTAGSPQDYEGREVYAKVRYSVMPSRVRFRVDGNRIISTFEQKQRAATPGQSIVFYDDNGRVLGGGFIV